MSIGKDVIYNKAFLERGMNHVVLWDIQRITHEQIIKIKFLSNQSKNRQGIWLKTDKGMSIPSLGSEIYKSVNLWEDTAPKEIQIQCYTDDGNLHIYNIWDEGDGKESQSYSSGMLIQEENGVLVYQCNDYGFETNFSSLVFSLEKL
ncbi:hypothetical protein [Fictibacillus nanhaiensis]|uniref:hypothetical protein n=1 Tax=Fictibacillus nanhaiensis TaxID=742169 RepID=UPI003C1AB19F